MRVLVATDFSKNANQALDYALFLLGDRMDELVLLTAVDIKAAGALFGLSLEDDLEIQSYEKLRKISSEISPRFPNLKISEVVKSGTLANVLVHSAEMYEPDFTVMGTNGTTGLYERIVGSNTKEVMNVYDRPLIVVPLGYEKKKVETVLLALDNPTNDQERVKLVSDFCQQINANLHMVSFVDEEGEMEPMPFDSKILGHVHFSQDQLVSSAESVEKQILTFADKDMAELICVFPHHKRFLKGLFHHSVTENVMALSKKPVMVIS